MKIGPPLLLALSLSACGSPTLDEVAPAAPPPPRPQSYVLDGEVPGLPRAEALSIAVARFNAISPLAAYCGPHVVGSTHIWGDAEAGHYWVESYACNGFEVCYGAVRLDRTVASEGCYFNSPL